MSEGLISVSDMAEIPKDTGAAPGRGSSKGVNLFLARQKLIADMMEQEEQEEKDMASEGSTTRVHKPVAFGPGKENISTSNLTDESKKLATSICLETQAMGSTQVLNFATAEHKLGVSSPHFDREHDSSCLQILESSPRYASSALNNNNEEEIKSPSIQLSEVDDETVALTTLPHRVLPRPQLPTVTLLQKSRAGEIPKGALYIGTDERIEGGYKHTDQFVLVPAAEQVCGEDNPPCIRQGKDNSSTVGTESRKKKDSASGLYQEIHRRISQANISKEDTNQVSPTAPDGQVKEQRDDVDSVAKYTVTEKPAMPATYQKQQAGKDRSDITSSNDKMVTDLVDTHCTSGAYPGLRSSTTERSLSVDTSISHDNPFSSSAGSHTSKSSAGSSRSLSSPSIQYREIQKGGEIPFSGLRKPAPLSPPPKVEVPKKIPTPVAGYDRAPVPIPRDQRDKLDARRRELLSKLERDERKKKASEEEVERRSRRHSDYFTLNEKSPIAHDRYDRSHVFTVTSAPQSPAHYSTSAQNSPRSVVSECSRLTAVVLYHFSAHHSRELSVLKDDNITIIRRVDANWYEASKDDRRGIIPVSYVQILRGVSVSPSPPERPVSPTLREGTAVAKYNFNPQTNAELALKRGDQVSLIRRIDRNWYEGSLQGSMTAGIFPASYVQVISDPESDSNARSAPAINRSMSAPSGSPRHRTSMGSPLSTRSNNHCSPNRTQLRHGSGVYNPSETSPLQGTAAYGSQLASPTGRTPSSGYGSPDLVYYETRHSNCTNNNNENDSSMRVKPHLPRNGHISEEPDSKECVARPLGGLEMPSYRSLYNYAPHNEDELELNEGDIVHVIEKCADGWFVGTSGRTGMFGTFPGNYVTPV